MHLNYISQMWDIVDVVKVRELQVRLQTSLLILEADGIKVICALAIPIGHWWRVSVSTMSLVVWSGSTLD